jgi:LmbE family N-acetylglucosaminyl deacetylase
MKFNNVLIVIAHPDDECLGCGGTIAKLTRSGCVVDLLIMTNGESSREGVHEKDISNRRSAAIKSSKVLGINNTTILDYPDNSLDTVTFLSIVKSIEANIMNVQYDALFTHFSYDMNIDHKLTSRAALTACRPQPNQSIKTILTFEVPSSTDYSSPSFGHVFSPNYFVDISSYRKIKLEALSFYNNELRDFPHSRSIKAIESHSISRGASVGVSYAEAFMLERHTD